MGLLRLLHRAPSPPASSPVVGVLAVCLPFYALADDERLRVLLPVLGFLLQRWTALQAARFAAAACGDEALVLAVPAWRRALAVLVLAGLAPLALAACLRSGALAFVVLTGVLAGAGLGARSGSVAQAVARASWWSFLPTLTSLAGVLALRSCPTVVLVVPCLASPTLPLMLCASGRADGGFLLLGAAVGAAWAGAPWLVRWNRDCQDAQRLHLGAGLVFTVALLAVVGPVRTGCGGMGTACRSNLKNVGTALAMYADDFGGRYPARLSQLVPNYLRTIPTCPSAGEDTYSAAFASTPAAYTVVCAGRNHRAVDLPANYPQYTSESGLVAR